LTDNDELVEMLRQMKQDQIDISWMMTQIMWHMRGSLSREEAWTLCPEERDEIMKLIKEHKDVSEKSGIAMF
jgi:hypothetical protein